MVATGMLLFIAGMLIEDMGIDICVAFMGDILVR